MDHPNSWPLPRSTGSSLFYFLVYFPFFISHPYPQCSDDLNHSFFPVPNLVFLISVIISFSKSKIPFLFFYLFKFYLSFSSLQFHFLLGSFHDPNGKQLLPPVNPHSTLHLLLLKHLPLSICVYKYCPYLIVTLLKVEFIFKSFWISILYAPNSQDGILQIFFNSFLIFIEGRKKGREAKVSYKAKNA